MRSEIRDYSEKAGDFVINESKKHSGDETICYPYAFGYSLSEMSWLLEHLELNKKQIKRLTEWTDRFKFDII